jgi:hypothetical protein
VKQSDLYPPVQCTQGSDFSLNQSDLVDLLVAVLATGRSFRFRAKGWSMAPFIRDGDLISVSPVPPRGPAVGQVVAFLRADSGQLVVHRVIAAGPQGYAIRGDNVAGFEDAAVARERIIGCVTQVTRDGKEVRLGLGPESRLIAGLSRTGWLRPLRARIAPLRSLFRSRKRQT